jgi:hypothetical protein
MSEQSCPINQPDLTGLEVVAISPATAVKDYQEAVALAREQAERRFAEYMLVSWYDRDRDFESPPHTTECPNACRKEGYIHYALSHGAKLKVEIEAGRFEFFFAPVLWE